MCPGAATVSVYVLRTDDISVNCAFITCWTPIIVLFLLFFISPIPQNMWPNAAKAPLSSNVVIEERAILFKERAVLSKGLSNGGSPHFAIKAEIKTKPDRLNKIIDIKKNLLYIPLLPSLLRNNFKGFKYI
jgi:hypothetical protein